MARVLVLSSAVFAALFVIACGGGGGGGNNAAGLESAAEDVWVAIFSGNSDDAYGYLTEECKEEVSEREFRAVVSAIPEFAELFFDIDAEDIEIEEVETRNVEDNSGEARVTLRVPDNDDATEMLNEGNEFQEWVYEDGGWRIPDCEDFSDPTAVDSGDDDGDDNGNGSSDGGNGSDDGHGDDDDDSGGSGSGDGAGSGSGSDSESQTSRDDPAPLGTAVAVAGWEITVNSVDPNATEAILATDDFIEPPEDGDVFFLINLTAKYVGDGESDSKSLFGSITWGAVGDSSVAYDTYEDVCTFFGLPDELNQSSEVFEGGSITGNLCYSIAEEDADSLQLFAEDVFSFDETREWLALR